MTERLIQNWVTWIVSVLSSLGGVTFEDPGYSWFVLFLVCFLVTVIVAIYIIRPLGFYMSEEGGPGWELFIFGFLVFGSFLFLINQVFDQPMPTSILPTWIIRLFGGYESTFVNASSDVATANTWSFLPWMWYLGPILFLYIRTRISIKIDGEG